MRKITATLIVTSLLALHALTAREETIVLGGQDGWESSSLFERLIRVSGRLGGNDLQIMPFRHESDQDTEFLLHFDSVPLRDSAARFAVTASSPELSLTTSRGGTAGLLVDDPGDVVDLTPMDSILFMPGVEWGSFTLEFWLYPVSLNQGDRIVEWEGREDGRLNFREQRFLVDIHNRRVRFSLINFFAPADGSPYTVALEGDSGLIPRRWSHHMLRFSDETALLEYLVDGRTVAVTHVSESGREDGSVFYPRMAAYFSESVHLVSSFTGAIDEVRLLRRFELDSDRSQFHSAGGVYESITIDLGSPGALLTGVSAITRTPAMTNVFVYYRIRSAADRAYGDWVPVGKQSEFSGSTSRFVQLRAELLPDLQTPESPVLSEISITYIPDPPPIPPVRVRATPHDGWVELSWAPVLEEDVQGYLVYYGVRPGRYFGSDADLGPSPIDVGQVTAITLLGLENGTLHYFAVSAYDEAGVRSATELSPEVAARPARFYGD